jgi:release factor glutamine methyltransferase
MTVGDFLTDTTKTLTQAGVKTARLDCLILLEDTLGMERASIIAHPEAVLNDKDAQMLSVAITKRAQHIPLAYIRGSVMFYGRKFIVSEHVLVPRPETEAIIDLVKPLPLETTARIADIGTGSGCIGITIALELPFTSVTLYDIDDQALETARKNSEQLGARNVSIAPLNVLEALPEACNVIVTNLPYVPEKYPINKAASFEPALALFSGPDGLGHYRALWGQLGEATNKPQYVIAESLPNQHHIMAQLARNSGYVLEKTDDFIQLFSL